MAPHMRLRARAAYVQASVVSLSLLAPCVSQAVESRPPLSAACLAWDIHIAELINQHSLADDLSDEEFSDAVRLFSKAQSACIAARFAEGLAIYEAIPIGAVVARRLR